MGLFLSTSTILPYLAPSCLPLGHSWGHLGASWGHFWNPLGPSWGHSGPSWSHLGAILAHLGAILGHLKAILDHLRGILTCIAPPWVHLGGILAHYGLSWGHLGAILGPSRDHLGAILDLSVGAGPSNTLIFVIFKRLQVGLLSTSTILFYLAPSCLPIGQPCGHLGELFPWALLGPKL